MSWLIHLILRWHRRDTSPRFPSADEYPHIDPYIARLAEEAKEAK